MMRSGSVIVAFAIAACGPGPRPDTGGPGGPDSGGNGGSGNGTCFPCSADLTQVLDCDGNVVETCPEEQLCGNGQCMAACDAATANRSSVGCDYYATAMAAYDGGFGGCFVAFIANTWHSPARISADWGGAPIDLATYAKIPHGSGPSITYGAYDPNAGLAAGEVAILFLSNDPVEHGTWSAPAACPVPAAIGLDAHVHYFFNISSGRTKAFHITTDKPIVSYQMLPYNAATSASTGATLLLPSSAWDTDYIGVEASRPADAGGISIPPSLAIIAKEPTHVTVDPTSAIVQGIDVAPTAAHVPITYTMAAGQTMEFIQLAELSGSTITADKPIAVIGGHMGLRVPYNVSYSEHAEQQIPPVHALGSEYAVASYRDRLPPYVENRHHRIVGVVPDTHLVFDPPIAGAPTTLGIGVVTDFATDTPYVVRSQDADHPFLVFTYMGGSQNLSDQGAPAGYGDAEFVRIVPGLQYLPHYVFFTDPTYPETNLVVVRRRGANGFYDVKLDCVGMLTGWQPMGTDGTYEVTRVDLSHHNFEGVGTCNTGRHEMESVEPFGVTVWGWGTPETRAGLSPACFIGLPGNTCDVSYAYPAGENVKPINQVIILKQ